MEERGDEGPAEGKAERGGWVKGGEGGGVSEECKWGMEGGGASMCVCVCTHRGVVLGEALMEKP